jgi:polar amino acid transport system substrate-binding protein
MKQNMRFITLLFMLFVLLPNVGQAKDTVRLAIMEYPPLIGEKLDGYGIEPTIVTAAFREIGVDVEYIFFPPARAFKAAEEGVYDGTVGWVWSEERAKEFDYSEPIFTAPLLLFHLKEFPFDWEKMDDLKGIPIGITVKNYYGPKFHRAMDGGILTVDESSKDIVQFDKLLRHRIKLYPMNHYTGYYLIKEKFTPEQAALFTHHPRPLKTSVYHVLFSRAVKENDSLIKRFNRGLRQLKESGEYDRIIKAHMKGFSMDQGHIDAK